jgi:hypothetical protein
VSSLPPYPTAPELVLPGDWDPVDVGIPAPVQGLVDRIGNVSIQQVLQRRYVTPVTTLVVMWAPRLGDGSEEGLLREVDAATGQVAEKRAHRNGLAMVRVMEPPGDDGFQTCAYVLADPRSAWSLVLAFAAHGRLTRADTEDCDLCAEWATWPDGEGTEGR